MSRIIILGNMFILASIISGIALYKLEIRISLISLILLILKIIIDRDYKVIVNYGSVWTIFTLITLCTGYFQKRDSLYYSRGLIAIFSMLMFIAVCIYAFRKVLF